MSHDVSGSAQGEVLSAESVAGSGLTPAGVRQLLTDLGSTATTESKERDARAGIWKLLHYVIGTAVVVFGVATGTVVLTNAGMTKEQAGVLLLIGGAISAAYTFWNTRERMNTNFSLRDEYASISRETTAALALVDLAAMAAEYRRINLRYEAVRKGDSASRAG